MTFETLLTRYQFWFNLFKTCFKFLCHTFSVLYVKIIQKIIYRIKHLTSIFFKPAWKPNVFNKYRHTFEIVGIWFQTTTNVLFPNAYKSRLPYTIVC